MSKYPTYALGAGIRLQQRSLKDYLSSSLRVNGNSNKKNLTRNREVIEFLLNNKYLPEIFITNGIPGGVSLVMSLYIRIIQNSYSFDNPLLSSVDSARIKIIVTTCTSKETAIRRCCH